MREMSRSERTQMVVDALEQMGYMVRTTTDAIDSTCVVVIATWHDHKRIQARMREILPKTRTLVGWGCTQMPWSEGRIVDWVDVTIIQTPDVDAYWNRYGLTIKP